MKIGIVTDIHNNIAALEAVLLQFRKEGCDGVVCCGDIIGIGAYPEETVQAVMAVPNLLVCVRGNHEDYLRDGLPVQFPNKEGMGRSEMEYHRWEHSCLSQQSKDYLAGLPCRAALELEGKSVYLCHYSMDERGHYTTFQPNPSPTHLAEMFADIEADIVLYGHNHQSHVQMGERCYINCGSLGCPGQERNIARAGILELGEKISFTAVRAAYNVDNVLADMDNLDFPAREEIQAVFYAVGSPE